MHELDELIKRLENEIKRQHSLLDNYIERESWGQAANQENFIAGLRQALILAQALHTELSAKERN